MSDNMRWYAVHTYSGHEQKVQRYLESMIEEEGFQDQIGRIVVPTEDFIQMKDGKKSILKRKFLPSYILIQMALNKDSMHMVTSTPGVTSFVGPGKTPQPLDQAEMDRILGKTESHDTKVIPLMTFRIGDRVKVIDGPFLDFAGAIDDVNPEKNKVKVMVSIFGRPTPVELDVLQVELITDKG